MRGFLMLAMLVLTISAIACAVDETPPFKIETKRTDDRVEVKSENNKTIFDVRSPFGISRATIERTTEQWPEKVLVRLRLNGLENFNVSNEELKLQASVSSQNGDVRLWKDGKEDMPLDSKSPYWMEIRLMDRDGKPTKALPLKAGYIEMQLPKKLFEVNPKSIALEWIDFYRN
ncbi:MAG: hypothetical protein NTU79_11715 [Planctomycetota bacterium]|nr:hypothetical protein [Planctomycetota bacterium]